MSRVLVAAIGVAAVLLAPVGTEARGGGYGGRGYGGRGYGHGGRPARYHGYHGSPRVFFYGSFGWPYYGYPYPYYYTPYYYAPYPYAWSYPYAAPSYDVPSYDAPAMETPPTESGAQDTPSDPLAANYGLVQLRGVPDGAEIDLDGRFWLRADRLDQRWLALPHGEHELVVRVASAEPVSRRVVVEAGRNQVVRFTAPRPSP